ALTGRVVQVFINGLVTLEGRLDLDVLAQTQRMGPPSVQFLRFIGVRVPMAGPIPVSLLIQASTYLSNRLIHLRVTGTYRSPTIQIEPISLLADEAVRYFVNQAALPLP